MIYTDKSTPIAISDLRWCGRTSHKIASPTSWYGHVAGNTITTRWVLTYLDHNGAAKKMRGTDTFQKQF